jgi:hypothetical protein
MLRLMTVGFLIACGMAQAEQVLVNPGFESGSLTPWADGRSFSGGPWTITSTGCHSGSFCATDDGNTALVQTFSPVAVSDITDISFFAEHPNAAVTAVAVDLDYSGGGDDEFIVDTSGSGYNFFDVFADLRATGSLDGFEVFGNSAGVTLLDDASITTSASPTPEPATFGLMLTALLGAMAARARRA